MILQPVKALLSIPTVIHWAEQPGLLLKEAPSHVYLHIQPVIPAPAHRVGDV